MAVKVTTNGTTTEMNREQFMEFMRVLWEQAQENKAQSAESEEK